MKIFHSSRAVCTELSRFCGGIFLLVPLLLSMPGMVKADASHEALIASGGRPSQPMVQSSDGHLYAITSGQFYRLDADGSNMQTIACLRGGRLIASSDGYLYSTTGGLQRYSEAGGCEIIRSFDATADGVGNPSQWVESADGQRLYGVSGQVIFSVKKDGTGLQLLKTISTGSTDTLDGRTPSSLIRAQGGGVYGLAKSGGVNLRGVLFHLADDGTYSKLYEFAGSLDGYLTFNRDADALVQVPGGDLFGITYGGGCPGRSNEQAACGVIFRYSPASSTFSVLHSFSFTNGTNTDGFQGLSIMYAPLDPTNPQGVLYATTQQGGAYGSGTIVAIDPVKGDVLPLLSMPASSYERANSMMQAADGQIYGTAGGFSSQGGFFRFDPGVVAFDPYIKLSAITSYSGSPAFREDIPIVQNKSLRINWTVGKVKDCLAVTNDPGSEWAGARSSSGSNVLVVVPRSTGAIFYTLSCISTDDDTTVVSASLNATVLSEQSEDVHIETAGASGLWMLCPLVLLACRRGHRERST